MYILNWNPEQNLIEASFGGFVTNAEAEVFAEEFREVLLDLGDNRFEAVIDFAMVPRMEDKVLDSIKETRETALFAGANCITFVARNEDETASLVDERLQQVLEGKERYVAYSRAA
ncbi:MAG: hypothetical protein KF812_05855 [Fimbriimonadaceae bacterium]|nr:hypothetical protein [Fimbriimonadaceae bacterium]